MNFRSSNLTQQLDLYGTLYWIPPFLILILCCSLSRRSFCGFVLSSLDNARVSIDILDFSAFRESFLRNLCFFFFGMFDDKIAKRGSEGSN